MSGTLAIFQFIAYICLTLSSVIVAIISAIIAYRNNFGWKPLLILVGYGLRGRGGSDSNGVFFASINFEIWNRQKYPIALRNMTVEVSDLKLIDPLFDNREEIKEITKTTSWRQQGQMLYYSENMIIGPSSFEKFTTEAAFPRRSLDNLDANIHIEAAYFDPRTSKTKIVSINFKYNLNSTTK